MVNTGIITQVQGENITIVFDRPDACGECHACSRGSENCKKHEITLPGKGKVGDHVEVEIDDSQFVAASALAYLPPLAGLILGLVAGYALSMALLHGQSEPLIALASILGVFLGYLIMRRLNPRFSRGRWQPRILAVHEPEKDK